MRTALSLVTIAALTALSATASAQNTGHITATPLPVLTATAVIGTPGFGDGYEIVSAQRTSRSAITMTVALGGGCAPHDFVASYRTDATGVRVSLHHESHDDACEAMLSRRFVIVLPATPAPSARIHVEGPDRSIDLR